MRDNFLILPSSQRYGKFFNKCKGNLNRIKVANIDSERPFYKWGLDVKLESKIRFLSPEEQEFLAHTYPENHPKIEKKYSQFKDGVMDLNSFIKSRNGQVTDEEYGQMIFSAKYHQKTAYTVQKVIRNQCEMTAFDFKKMFTDMFTFKDDYERSQYDSKFAFTD